MLVLTRRPAEQIVIRLNGEIVVVSILAVDGSKVRLGFEADPSVEVNRKEVDDRKYRDPVRAVEVNLN